MRRSLPPIFASLTLVAAAVAACAGGPSPSVGGAPLPVLDAGADAEPAALAAAKTAPAEDPELARIAALPEDERLAYARARLPDFQNLRISGTAVDFSRFVKAGPTLALFVSEDLPIQSGTAAPQRSCRRVVFEVHPDHFRAEVPLDGGEGRPTFTRAGSFVQLVLDQSVTLYGPYTRTVETNARGERREGTRSSGTAWSPPGALFEIREDAILYGATPVSAEAVCTMSEERPCAEDDGGVGACARCTHIVAKVESHDPSHHVGIASGRAQYGKAPGQALPACAACPADDLGAEVTRINRALAGLVLADVPGGAWPAFFTKKQACVEMARKRAEQARRAQ